jgi:DNA polymerase II small subunit
VYNKRITKNGNVLLEIEDLSGRTIAIINKDRKEVFEKSKEILLDEVIGIKCSGNEEIVFVNDLVFPDSRILEKKYSKEDEYIAFTSDMHIGSDKFLESEFLKFIDWINGNVGNEQQRAEALKVNYLFITGDSIDGVGVYPGQESQLVIQDVDKQYDKLVELLAMIRSDVNIIHCAGQHDAVRIAEPQPIVGESYGSVLKNLNNIYRVTNPSLVEVGKDVKFKVLMYHGASMHGIINSIEALRLGSAHDSPTSVVKYMLKKRHLAPTHSLVTYTPLDKEDALLIKDVPDIIATGDLHRPEVSDYNGVLLIASSCWQARTPFEEKVGNNPDPCKVPIMNLKTREVKIIDFSGGEDAN